MFEFIYNAKNDTIRINGDIFSLKDFLEVIPNYTVSDSIRHIHYIPDKKHTIDIDGIIVPESVRWDSGDFYISKHNDLKLYIAHNNAIEKEISRNNRKQATKTHPDNSYDVNRKIEYPTTEELIVALWEGLVEKSSSGKLKIKELQLIRKSVKNRFPKT
jgi:hypothetical protein